MQLRSRLRIAAVLGFAVMLHASLAQATTVRPASIVDLIDQAEAIIVAEVVSIEDGFDSRNMPYSDITLDVTEDILGGRTGRQIVRQFGLQAPKQMPDGTTALSVTPPGFPNYRTDEKVVLFLYQASPMNGMQTTVGLTQGKFTVDAQGMVLNELGNSNLFRHVGALTDRMPEADQKVIANQGGKLNQDAFLSFVRNAVEQRWVEEGVLYHEH